MVGKKFEELSRKRIVEVVSIEGAIAMLSNGERVAIEKLRNPGFYREEGQRLNESNNVGGMPLSFEAMDNNRYKKILNGAVSKLQDSVDIDDRQIEMERMYGSAAVAKVEGSLVENSVDSYIPRQEQASATSKAAVRQIDDEEDDGLGVPVVSYRNEQALSIAEKELAAKYANPGDKAAADFRRQAELMGKYADDEFVAPETDIKLNSSMTMADLESNTVNKGIQRPYNREEYLKTHSTSIVKIAEHPLKNVFSSPKKSKVISLNLKLNEKIPDKAVIKMFEQNFDNHSAIEYYADEIYKKLLEQPEIIRDQIEVVIRDYVNGRVAKKKTPVKAKPKTTSNENK